mgnify:CR=1 FL=1
MKPYRRTNTPNAPYYVQFFVNGRRVQYCTGKTEYYEARLEGMRYAVEAREGRVAVAAAAIGRATVKAVCIRYQESALHVDGETKKYNVVRLRSILKANGMGMEVSVGCLTRELVHNFQAIGLKGGRSAIGINSHVRQARSIFSVRCMPLYADLALPDLRPFMSAPLLPEPVTQYVPPPARSIDAIHAKAAELKTQMPAAYAGFLLAALCGLRSKEIIHAKWSWVQHTGDGWVIEIPAGFSKSKRARLIRLANNVHEELCAVGGSEYLIAKETENARSVAIRRDLSKWLRDNGVKRGENGKTVHELRKYFGSIIATKHGIFAAQKVLGHSTPAITSKAYAGLLELPEPVSLCVSAGA